ncbi:sugar transferase [Halomonas sp. MCCC 1A11058]|uniref:Sugar transferase n=1 Tax=Billgrantia aerodenitrificans TaxID=2733483 RepID=A0ABS9AVJ1_9GAMM|nr:sugar transferase [Halomonas aerodenitrificans]
MGLIVASVLVYWLSITTVYRLSRFPGTKAYLFILPAITLSFAIALLILKMIGLELTRSSLALSYMTIVTYCLVEYAIDVRLRRLRLAVLPHGRAPALCQHSGVDWQLLQCPDLGQARVDGVVADLRADFPAEWKRFLANCTIHGVPVYHATSAHEMITGRVPLDYLYENEYGSLTPQEDYALIKRGLDTIAVIALSPLLLPAMVLIALVIRLDSPGSAIFTQLRMGYHCRPFIVYKFRSMYVDSEGKGFTELDCDPRITRVGRVIRKYRLDELPQLFNVLRGEMSLIGPRPESMMLTDVYERDVPFFHYRHLVRPGISGWAQVEQGYAVERDGMIRKLEYDFYYIKHFSFWLDVLIVLRTIKILVTGFGAR